MVDTTADNDFGTMMTEEELQKALAPEVAPEDDGKIVTPEDDSLAPEESVEPEAETEEVEIPEEDQEESANLKLKPKKKTVQERIDEVTAARRAAEREADELRRQLRELSQKKEEEPKPKQVTPAVAEVKGPTPEDLDAAGEAKYPMGEFDPEYIRDLTRFTIQQERDAMKAQEAAERQAEQERSVAERLSKEWQEKLAASREELPDLQEKGMKLEATFESLEPEYGQYIAQTIMSLDHGPEVLYYLSDNLEEAAALMAQGPLKATLGLGALNSMFSTKKPDSPIKVTNAPEPPADRARGTNSRFETPDDTDDLEAFAKKFYGT